LTLSVLLTLSAAPEITTFLRHHQLNGDAIAACGGGAAAAGGAARRQRRRRAARRQRRRRAAAAAELAPVGGGGISAASRCRRGAGPGTAPGAGRAARGRGRVGIFFASRRLPCVPSLQGQHCTERRKVPHAFHI